jgi:hypothetical protein
MGSMGVVLDMMILYYFTTNLLDFFKKMTNLSL